MASVGIIVRTRKTPLVEAVAGYLAERWHPDFTMPRIYTLAAADSDLVADAGRAMARVASQKGVVAPVFDLVGGNVRLEPSCKHRIGITDLPLGDHVDSNMVLYGIAPWTRVAPRSRQLLMRISPQLDLDVVINAESANPVLLVQIGSLGTDWLAVLADDLIAAEVVGRALRAVAVPEDWDGINPWQHPLVQIGVERNLGVRGPDAIDLRVDAEGVDPDGPALQLIRDARDLVNLAVVS